MTLEDFFTLTEMKDGLTSNSRVEELVSMLQKDKDYFVTNVSEAARQWSTVASTLVATENRDTLDHFVRLNGVLFLDQWLQEAQKFNTDTCGNSMEESISLLLEALKKFPIDNKRSMSSGIGSTVKKLIAHKSFKVQERARALFNCWNQGKDSNKDHMVLEEVGRLTDDGVNQVDGTVAVETWCLQHSSLDNTPIECNADGEPVGKEHQHSTSSNGCQSKGTIKDVNSSVTSNKDSNPKILNQENKEDGFRENAQDSLFTSMSRQGSISLMEETSTCPAERMPSIEICSIPDSVEWRSSDTSKLQNSSNDPKETDSRNYSPDNIGQRTTSSVSASSGSEAVSSTDHANVMQSDVVYDTCAKEAELCTERILPGVDDDKCTLDTESKKAALGTEKNPLELEGTDQVGGSYSEVMQNSSFDGCILRKPDNLAPSFSEDRATETTDNIELASESYLNVGYGYETNIAIPRAETDAKVSEINKSPGMEFEYGIDDALEVARQVAKEVEREVVDYRKQFSSSSSDKNSQDGVKQPGSPDSINDEKDQFVVGSQNEMAVEQNDSCRDFPSNEEDHLMKSESVVKTEDCTHKADKSQDTETVQKPVDDIKKGLCDFDLNELCSEEMDQPTITFVSASKVPPAGVPKAPLHFEGELGWKGSAATSAFRPASARRASDCEKLLSIEGSSPSSKQRQGFLDIDLNVAEGYGDGAPHAWLGKHIPVSSDLPSGESSVEVSSRRAQRLKLDLNRVGDTEDTPSSDCRMEERFRYHQRNDSPSPASSSSSRQFPMRNIDLNGNPSLFDDSSDQRPGYSKCSSQDMNACRTFKLDDPVVSIMGARVAINRSEPSPQTRSFLPNGRGVESAINAVFTRSENGLGTHHLVACTPSSSSLFGYNGFNSGSAVSLSPGIYGPGSVPCMVDSRGNSVVPQMMPSTSDCPPSQLPFLMSMTGPVMGLNGVSRPSLDLNSGLTLVDAESRDTGGLRPLFISGPGMSMEEQMRYGSLPMGAKRKEPDGGWDLYSVGYKHQPPWR